MAGCWAAEAEQRRWQRRRTAEGFLDWLGWSGEGKRAEGIKGV